MNQFPRSRSIDSSTGIRISPIAWSTRLIAPINLGRREIPNQYDSDELILPPYLVDTPEMREAMTRYYAEITDFDREVGQCMKAVEQSQGADNTIFLYTVRARRTNASREMDVL